MKTTSTMPANPARHADWIARQIANCERKRSYRSMRVALNAGRSAGFPEHTVYRCEVCGEWHLTSKGGAG